MLWECWGLEGYLIVEWLNGYLIVEWLNSCWVVEWLLRYYCPRNKGYRLIGNRLANPAVVNTECN